MFTRFKTSFLLKFVPLALVKKLDNRIAKRLFFLKQYEGTQKRIWGNEFAIESMKEAREVLRREYDKLNETLDAEKIAYAKNEEKPEPDKTLRESFERLIETKSKEIEEWKKKIDAADEQLEAIQFQIDSYYEQLPRLKKWIKKS